MSQLPKDLPAAVCIVLHVAAEHRSYLPQILSRVGPLSAEHPLDHAPLERGRIYVAPNDHHLLVNDKGLLRYRCRVGHGYTGEALNDGQVLHVDSALWAAVRALKENAALARRLAVRAREQQHFHSARRYDERAREAEVQARAVRHLATHGRKHGGGIGLSGGEKETPEQSN